MSGQHTPGPWIAEGSEMNATVWVRGPDGKRVCSVKRCETDFDNARLIAAAPDLYEALKAALPYLGSAANEHIHNDWDENARIEAQARAALAKADA